MTVRKFFTHLFRPLLLSLAGVLIFIPVVSAIAAQPNQPDGPYYVVQPGNALWDIAARFKVSLDDIEKANEISDPGQLKVGVQLVIPGLEGIQGQVDTRPVAFGETLGSLSRAYRTPVKTLIRLNPLTSPAELYIGLSLIIPVSEQQPDLGRYEVAPGHSLLEMAVMSNSDPWNLVLKNNLSGSWNTLPNDILRIPQNSSPESQNPTPGALPASITSVNIDPLMPKQGKTVEIKIVTPEKFTLKGSLVGYDLHFFRYQDSYVALQGIPAMLPPGLYPLDLEGKLSNGEQFAFSQMILIRDAEYPYDPALSVNPETVGPAVTVPEQEMWAKLGIQATPEKLWDGQFGSPVPAEFKDCWTSRFGNRRSYNGGTYDFFHSRLDFCGRVGTELYAVAPGKVVYTGSLVVRGGVVVINHGWGVYTAYDHLSEILVKAGDMAQTGQVIGLGGATGRTTGPHLHWEVWAGGVQVDPVDWLQRTYP